MAADDWIREWPRCLLLLELASRYTASGRTQGCGRLKDRLEEWRVRMDGAPGPVHLLLSELCYVAWLLHRGDLTTARHHVAEAGRKAQDIRRLVRSLEYEKARSRGAGLRQRSLQLRERSQVLRELSHHILTQSHVLREPRSALPRGAHA